MSSTKNILTIYAGQDKVVLQYLLLHLRPLEKDFNVAIWSDDAIDPQQPWKPQNAPRLDRVDIFLLLISNTFMYSEFIKQDEFKVVIDRYKEGKATVIPILLNECPWDVEFTSDDYNFSFRELQVFPANEKPIRDWNSTDEAFKEIADYIRGLLTSSTKKSAPEEPANKDGKKMLNTKKEEQIAIDFVEEREVNNKAERDRKKKIEVQAKKGSEENNKQSEDAEAKEVIGKEKRLRRKAEIQKRIENEKRLKEKAKKENKIEEEAKAKKVLQEEKSENEEAKAKNEAEKKKHIEIKKSERETQREKRPEEVVVAQKTVTEKNRLAGYNHQFKTAKVVEAKRVVKEKRRGNEEAKAQIAREEKRRVEKTKSEIETERSKRPEEVVKAQKTVTEKSRLAGYNYQFNTSKVVKAKRGVREKRRGNEEAKAQMAREEIRRVEKTKSERVTQRAKGLGEVVVALKRIVRKNPLAVGHKYQFKLAREANPGPDGIKKKKNINEKRRIHSGFLIAALVICGLLIYVFTGDSERQSTTFPETRTTEVVSDAEANMNTDSENQGASFSKLGIGDSYDGGIIFAIDPSNKTGKIAYPKDAGPMPWINAMSIHEQLGVGWRLPTLDELQLMYQTIGQGATNRGQFADGLYWSSTSYDTYQARLLRFRNGNTSYHYNKMVDHRKFHVRAVRDFRQ